MNKKPKTALQHILLGLIPYSKQNLDLAFHPNRFFNDLERITGYKNQTLRATVSRAKNQGLIARKHDLLTITAKGQQYLRPFTATRLANQAQLMIIFDIPEAEAHLRRQLRLLLREWHFIQVQKSVWVTNYDYRDILVEAADELGLQKYVQVFEAARLYPK